MKRNQPKSDARAEQVASNKYQLIKLGLNVHADSIVVVRIIENSAPQPAQRFAPGDFIKWIQSQLRQAQGVHSCYEAGPFGFVLHRARFLRSDRKSHEVPFPLGPCTDSRWSNSFRKEVSSPRQENVSDRRRNAGKERRRPLRIKKKSNSAT